MKKLITIGLMMLMMAFSVSAFSVSSTGTATHIGAINTVGTSSGSSGNGGNHVNYETTLTEKGTPGCYDSLKKRAVSATGFDGYKPIVSPAFTECVGLYSSDVHNQGRDFESADKYWNSWTMKERADGYDPYIMSFDYQVARALRNA